MKQPLADDPIQAVALLDEPNRQRLYDLVAANLDPTGRDAAAAALGISRELAAFHLDRLVQGGLLETEYRRPSGRTGPGAGRPAKLYRRANSQVAISLPPRNYAFAADVMATALDRSGGASGAGGGGHRRSRTRRRRRRWGTPSGRSAAGSPSIADGAAGRPARSWVRAQGRDEERNGKSPQLPVPGPCRRSPRVDLRDEPRLGEGRRGRAGLAGQRGACSGARPLLRGVPHSSDLENGG